LTVATEGPVTLLETDPDGGDLAARLGVATKPGLVTLAAATRHGFAAVELKNHLQSIAPNADLLAAPSSPEHASSALTAVGPFLATLDPTPTVIADVGRWKPRSPAADLVSASAAVVLVVHPTVEGVAHARWQFEDLSRHCHRVLVACRGERPYRTEEVAGAIGAESAVAVPFDRHGAATIGAGTLRRQRRSPLMRAARSISECIGQPIGVLS
jgi:hypothetical protein